MSLIRDLRDSAVDASKSLSETLRRALVLASLLGSEELRKWAKCELDGYPPDENLPDYRVAHAEVKGDFAGPFGYRVKNLTIPVLTMDLSEKLQEFLSSELRFHNGVRSLEAMIDDEDDSVKFAVPMEVVMLLPSIVEQCQCVSMWREVHRSAIEQILDSIRNRLLEIVLDLEKSFPEISESEQAVKEIDKRQAAAIIHQHIYGSSNVIAAGSQFSQSVQQQWIQPGDLDGLMKSLDELRIPGNEKEELRAAIKEDGKPKEGKVGKRVAGWLGRMTQKLLENGLTATPTILTKAISRYYGWE